MLLLWWSALWAETGDSGPPLPSIPAPAVITARVQFGPAIVATVQVLP